MPSISSSCAEINPKVIILLAKQQKVMLDNPPEGIKLIQNPADITDIKADIEGPVDTPYEGGVFRCVLRIDSEFPKSPPKGFFLTKIFHPNVDTKGSICVNTLKKDWNPAKWSLDNIFGVIRCLLIIPFPESSLNEEAGRLFMDDYDEYFKTAHMITKIHAKPCKEALKQSDSLENNNSFSNDSNENKNEDEEGNEKPRGISSKLKQNNSNLDVSMEEEKETSKITAFGIRVNNVQCIDSEDEMHDDVERKENKANFKFESQADKKVISGSSLFGAKAIPQKNKSKMKNMRKKLALD